MKILLQRLLRKLSKVFLKRLSKFYLLGLFFSCLKLWSIFVMIAISIMAVRNEEDNGSIYFIKGSGFY